MRLVQLRDALSERAPSCRWLLLCRIATARRAIDSSVRERPESNMSFTSSRRFFAAALRRRVVSSAALRADIQWRLHHRLLVSLLRDDNRHAAMVADLTRCSTSHTRKAASFSIFPIASRPGAFPLFY